MMFHNAVTPSSKWKAKAGRIPLEFHLECRHVIYNSAESTVLLLSIVLLRWIQSASNNDDLAYCN